MFEKVLSYLNSIPDDKVRHFCGGYILATALPIVAWQGLLLVVVAGVLKEVYDYYHQDKHTCDKYDMFATWGGGLLGFAFLMLK